MYATMLPKKPQARIAYSMKKLFMALMQSLSISLMLLLPGCTCESQQTGPSVPTYLYKITSPELWQQSQQSQELLLTAQDKDFIHLSRDDQLERIIEKFWKSHGKAYVVLKLDATRLPGILKFESNRPGGDNYYHLYNDSIPLSSVVEVID